MIAGNIPILFDDGTYSHETTSGPLLNYCRVYKDSVLDVYSISIGLFGNQLAVGTVVIEDGTIIILEEA